jgi:membrane-associated phospholipid phosphatase
MLVWLRKPRCCIRAIAANQQIHQRQKPHSVVRRGGKMNYKKVFLLVIAGGILLLNMRVVTAQDSMAMVTPDAGSWHTWLLESGSDLRLDAPPDEAATMAEIEELHSLLGMVDDDMRAQIQHWSANVPAYRWNKLASEEYFNRAVPHPVASYGLALMNVAIYDATIAAWDTKYAYMRPRPVEMDSTLTPLLATPHSPAYPAEHAVAAGAAATVLARLFPDKSEFFNAQAAAATDAMLHSGIYYPSDIEAGFALGQSVGEQAVAWAEANPLNLAPVDEIDGGEGKWSGVNPILPHAGTWPTWVLSSPDEFRPVPPLEPGSDAFEAEMQELRDLERTMRNSVFVRYWEFGSGAFQDNLRWTQHASTAIWEHGLDDNPPRGALVYAAMHVAGFDAAVSTFDAKYYYLAIRPFQYDPEFQTVTPTPNHPSYPSAHSVISMAMLATLGEIFPDDAAYLTGMSQQGSESRLWGGIHFRHDVVIGEEMGYQVAAKVLEPFAAIL